MSKRASNNYNSALLELVTERPIAFNTTLAKVARSASAGLFLSQLLYWWRKGSHPDWIYKTIREIEEETTLTRWEQATAIRIWKALGILEVELRGLPRKRYFHINIKEIVPLIERTLGSSHLRNAPSQLVTSDTQACGSRHPNTESTPEKTNRNDALQASGDYSFASMRKTLAAQKSVKERRRGGW